MRLDTNRVAFDLRLRYEWQANHEYGRRDEFDGDGKPPANVIPPVRSPESHGIADPAVVRESNPPSFPQR